MFQEVAGSAAASSIPSIAGTRKQRSRAFRRVFTTFAVWRSALASGTMTWTAPVANFVAECFCPDVDEAALHELDARAGASAAELAGAGESVRYLGSILMREDEVLLCLFDGTRDAVHRAAVHAEVPFERILEATGSPWSIPKTA